MNLTQRKIWMFIVLLATFARPIRTTPTTPLSLSSLYKEIGYEDPTTIKAAFTAGITQATNGVATGNINDVISGLTAAAKADPDATLAQMLNGQPFGRTALVKKFPTNDQLQDIITPVAEEFDSANSMDYISKYVDAGIADANFTEAMNKLGVGLQEGNLQDVLDAFKVVTSYPDDRYVGRLKVEISLVGGYGEPASYLSDLLISKFKPEDIMQICKAAQLEDSDILAIYEANVNFLNNVSALQSAYDSVNTSDMVNVISSMTENNPSIVSNFFKNNQVFDYESLSDAGFSDAEITQIAKAAGLSPADITSYLAGNYTGEAVLPPDVPVSPDQPVAPSTGTGSQIENNSAAAQEYYELNQVTAANLQQLIKQNQLTKSEFNQLIANQEANLAKLQEAGTATAEEIAEIQNEINISKQVENDPTTEFTPETVEPVVG